MSQERMTRARFRDLLYHTRTTQEQDLAGELGRERERYRQLVIADRFRRLELCEYVAASLTRRTGRAYTPEEIAIDRGWDDLYDQETNAPQEA